MSGRFGLDWWYGGGGAGVVVLGICEEGRGKRREQWQRMRRMWEGDWVLGRGLGFG